MIPVEVETYVQALLTQGQGYPLWNPNPSRALSTAYRDKGCGIGDLCIITPDGSVDFLWNICFPHDHPINVGRTPPDFVPVGIDFSTDIDEEGGWRGKWAHICNLSIKQHQVGISASLEATPLVPAGFRADFESSTSDIKAGVLILPEGADRYDVLRLDDFRDYAKRNARTWYKHVNGPGFRRGASEDSLYLVTGCKKTTSWAAASFRHHSENRGVAVEVNAAMLASGGVSAGYSWMISCPATTRSGPMNPAGFVPTGAVPPQNQCVFIRGFKIALREGVTQRLGLRSAVSLDTNPAKVKPGSKGPVPFRYGGGEEVSANDAAKGHSVARDGFSDKQIMGLDGASSGKSFSGKEVSGAAKAGIHGIMDNAAIILDPESKSPSSKTEVTSQEIATVDVTSKPGVVILDFPSALAEDVKKTRHPSDIINQWLLSKTEEADIAITHDDVWCSILNENDQVFPNPEELVQRISLTHDSYISFPNTVALRDRSVAHIDVLLENTLEGVQREAPNVNDVHLQALASRISVQQLQAAPNAAVSQPLSAQDVAQPQIVMQNAKQALQQPHSEISKPLPVGWTSHYDKEKGVWYYLNTAVTPPQISYDHPGVSAPATSPPPTMPTPNPGIASVITTEKRPIARNMTPAQQLYASSAHNTSMPAPSPPLTMPTPSLAPPPATTTKKPPTGEGLTPAQQLYASSASNTPPYDVPSSTPRPMLPKQVPPPRLSIPTLFSSFSRVPSLRRMDPHQASVSGSSVVPQSHQRSGTFTAGMLAQSHSSQFLTTPSVTSPLYLRQLGKATAIVGRAATTSVPPLVPLMTGGNIMSSTMNSELTEELVSNFFEIQADLGIGAHAFQAVLQGQPDADYQTIIDALLAHQQQQLQSSLIGVQARPVVNHQALINELRRIQNAINSQVAVQKQTVTNLQPAYTTQQPQTTLIVDAGIQNAYNVQLQQVTRQLEAQLDIQRAIQEYPQQQAHATTQQQMAQQLQDFQNATAGYDQQRRTTQNSIQQMETQQDIQGLAAWSQVTNLGASDIQPAPTSMEQQSTDASAVDEPDHGDENNREDSAGVLEFMGKV